MSAPARLRRWLPRRLWIFAAILATLVLAAILAPWIAPQSPEAQNLLGRLRPPGTEVREVTYLLGSDELGRDLLSRLIHGAQVSLTVAALSVLVSGTVGTMLGMIAAWTGG